MTSESVRIELGGEVAIATMDTWGDVADALVKKHGGIPQVTRVSSPNALAKIAPVAPLPEPPAPASAAPVYSDFGDASKQHVDGNAKARIEGLHAKLVAGGVKVDAKEQFFATGTRMAKAGYDTQAQRKREHDRETSLVDAAHALVSAVKAEGRENVEVSARELAASIVHHGDKVTALGLDLTYRSMRGLTSRLESPAFGYLVGLQKRIEDETGKPERDVAALRADRQKMAEILRFECLRAGDTTLKLRTRKSPGDIFAVLSPGYVDADAPEVIGQILDKMPGDAKGTWTYDTESTAWELRGNVWTPTPVEEQAVGEPFQGYVSFKGRDNGTRRVGGGGGIMLIRCLNASTYNADASDVSRVHRGDVMLDIAAMLQGSLVAINVLCDAWGQNREAVVHVPSGLTIEDAIPGFWRHLLRDRSSELCGVLPGRTENHVEALAETFGSERRDASKLVRADFAQGFTRYIQDQPTHVRRDAENAIGAWVVSNRPVRCDVRA